MRLQLFKIRQCGFYEKEEEGEIPQFGELAEWWDEFAGWIGDKEYKFTSTFSRSAEPHSVYCTGYTRDRDGAIGVALWNEAPSAEDRLFYLPPSGQVNNVRVEATELERGFTAGWPSYFWFFPTVNIMAALIPEGFRGSGVAHARTYFRDYLKKRSGYVRGLRPRRNPDDRIVVGYNRPGIEEALNLTARFETSPLRRGRPLDEIIDRWQEISKYVVNCDLEAPRPIRDRRLRNIVNSLVRHEDRASRSAYHRSFRLDLDWSPPSREEVLQVIRDWDEAGYDDNNWAGVRLRNENRIYRFDEMICRESIKEDSNFSVPPPWSVEDLKRAWMGAKPKAVSLVRQAGIHMEEAL